MYEKVMFDVETEIITDLIKALSKGNVGTTNWLTKKLLEQSKISKRVESILKSYAPAIERVIASDINDMIFNTSKETLALLKNAGVDLNITSSYESILTQYVSNLKNSYNITSAGLIGNTPNIYIDAANSISVLVSSGTITSDQAIEKLVRKWSNEGLKSVVDKAGRNWSAYSYSNMILRTTNRNITTNVQEQTFDDYDIDLVEISSHIGARPLCEPYQGKVYSRGGKSNKYPALTSTSMGEPAGLFGINCGHTMYPYMDGTKKTYKPYPKKENKRVYENAQTQRRLERNIRNAKRELQITKDAKLNNNAASLRVKNNQAKMREFIDDTGRTRYYSNERLI